MSQPNVHNSTVRAEHVAALVENLDDLQGVYFQPGGYWLKDESVRELVSAGDEAVEPLMKLFEADDMILTRAFYFGTDRGGSRTQERTPRHVREIAGVTLEAILGKSPWTSNWGHSEEVAAAHGNPDKIRATQLRAYWHRFKSVRLEERWYLTLLDDGAGTAAWRDAADNIVTPLLAPSGTNPPSSSLKGDSLRTKTNPSVTELLLRRADQIDPLAITRWDPDAALVLRRQTEKH